MYEPCSGCLAEECWGGLEPLNALSVDRPLQQCKQVRPVNDETHMPVQEYRPDRLSIKESAWCRWKAIRRDRFQEIFGHPAMLGDTGINRTSLKQELDDLPAINRKQTTPGQTHQDIIAQFPLFHAGDEDRNGSAIIILQRHPHVQRGVALLNAKGLLSVLLEPFACPSSRGANADHPRVGNLLANGSYLGLDLTECRCCRHHCVDPPSSMIQLSVKRMSWPACSSCSRRAITSCAARRVRCCSAPCRRTVRPGLGTGFGAACGAGAGVDVVSNLTAFACASWSAAASGMTCSSLASPWQMIVRISSAVALRSSVSLAVASKISQSVASSRSASFSALLTHSPMADSDVATCVVARTSTTSAGSTSERRSSMASVAAAVCMRSVSAASMPSLPRRSCNRCRYV